MAFALERAGGGCHDSGIVVISDGKRVALRRERVGWNQDQLASAAGVSRSSVWKVEKDHNVRVDVLKAIDGALEKIERKKGLGPTLSTPTGTTEPSIKEGADDVPVAVLEALSQRLSNLEALYATGLADLRLIRLELDNRIARRKSG